MARPAERGGGGCARRLATALALIGASAGAPQAASAQLRAGQTVASFELNLSNPGARSLALGGAFAGVADDATAAYANPAALVVLARPEASYEQRTSASAVDMIVWAGNKIVDDNDNVVAVRFDGANHRTPRRFHKTASFASATYANGRWAVALYGHRLAYLGATSARFERGEVFGPQFDTLSGVSLDVMGEGLSGAFRLTEDISVGATIARYSGRASVFEQELLAGSFKVLRQRSARIDGSDLGFSAGVLVTPSRSWSIGAYYRGNPSFAVVEENETPGRPRKTSKGDPLRFPDVFGLGAGYRLNEALLVTGEWSHVAYSNLDRVEELPSTFPDSRLRSKDADELRLGVEYSAWDLPTAPALRLGVWWDPAHGLQARGRTAVCPGTESRGALSYECRAAAPIVDPDDTEPLVLAANSNGLRQLFPGGKDRVHVTAGLGLLLGRRMQVDTALDFIDDGSPPLLSISALVRF
jgi:long-subunit fatty acid transport protein